jgi:hypothetical protein
MLKRWRLSCLKDDDIGIELQSVVIYQLFDNSIYFGKAEDRRRTLLYKSKDDDRYHSLGKMVVVEMATFKLAATKRMWLFLHCLATWRGRAARMPSHLLNREDKKPVQHHLMIVLTAPGSD